MAIVSLAALTVLDAGPAGQIRAAHAAGFSHVGLRLQPLVASDRAIVGDAAAVQEIETLLRETGVGVLEVGVFPITPELDLEACGPVLSLCHKLGAQFITCPFEDADRARGVETFGSLCDLAESCGLDALIEFNPYSACATLADARAIVEASGRDNARLLIDALHLSRSGGRPDDLRAIRPDLIALVHLCDARAPTPGGTPEQLRAESRTARLYPGEGTLWLDALLDAVPADTPLSVEAPSAADAHRSAGERAQRAFAATQAFLARHARQHDAG